MTIFYALILLAAGVALLMKGADWLVDGASSLARRLGVAPIVIGLTVVAFGTSMPELVVNLLASWSGKPDIAIGNIVGSNIANILLILGLSGLIAPLAVKRATVWKEIPMALLAMVLVWIMASDALIAGRSETLLDRIDGIVLIAFFVIFLYYTFGIGAGEPEQGGDDIKTYSIGRSWAYALGGVALLGLGGKLCVDGAITIAQAVGISERIIGLTIVAVGTSLPELMTSVIAAKRGNADIAVGNVVGSNIFNVFWILGVSAIIRPLPFSAGNAFDALVAVAATLALFAVMFIGKKHLLERWQAGAFIGLYVAYLIFLATGA